MTKIQLNIYQGKNTAITSSFHLFGRLRVGGKEEEIW